MKPTVRVYSSSAVGAYGYEEKPWFRPGRLDLFSREARMRGLDRHVEWMEPPLASDEELLLFHTRGHIERVRAQCATNEGSLDHGPTLARRSVERAATHVVGGVMHAARSILEGSIRRAFLPIAGFHHARPSEARSYCLWNDPAIVLTYLASQHIGTIAYVDVDVHYADGVCDAFAPDTSQPGGGTRGTRSRVVLADVHEDERTLWPNSPEAPAEHAVHGREDQCGEGVSFGTKLNVVLQAGATDADFARAMDRVEAFVNRACPAFVVFEAGADGLDGDPLGHLRLTRSALADATRRMCSIADRHASGRLLVLGGGGYNEATLGPAWCAVLHAMIAP